MGPRPDSARRRGDSMAQTPFPLPVSLFGRDLVQVCSKALEEAWALLDGERDTLIMSPEIVRITLAAGIVVAATTGVRDQRRLLKAALEYLDQSVARCLPQLEPAPTETVSKWKAPERFHLRAEKLRSARDRIDDPSDKDIIGAVAAEYERMARSAERIEASRKAINGLPPLARPHPPAS